MQVERGLRPQAVGRARVVVQAGIVGVVRAMGVALVQEVRVVCLAVGELLVQYPAPDTYGVTPNCLPMNWLAPCMAAYCHWRVCVCEWVNERHSLYGALGYPGCWKKHYINTVNGAVRICGSD